ncbi:MAG: MutS family DNA mismatch repair protein [Chitinophagaceae bacterium]
MRSPKEYYQDQLISLNKTLQGLYTKRSRYGWFRLAAAALGVFLIWLNWTNGAGYIVGSILFCIAIFLYWLRKDLSNNEAIEYHEALQQLNKEELLYLDHQYTHQPDGQHMAGKEHPYADDLDIFGRASVYQFMNRTASEQGNWKLAGWLSAPAKAAEIAARQDAAKALAKQIDWTQSFRAKAGMSTITIATEQSIRKWLSEPAHFLQKSYWHVVRFVVPAIAVATLLAYIFDYIDFQQFLVALSVFGMVAFLITKQVQPQYEQLNKISPQVDTLSTALGVIESAQFDNPTLMALRDQLVNQQTRASVSIQALNKILGRFDYKLNPVVYVPLNLLFLWDLQQVLQLEQWKKAHTVDVGHWFEVLSEMESLVSIATLHFNHPSWCFPEIQETKPEFTATAIGHPLIPPSKMVTSSFSTIGKGQINIITGSNMAGKSTFLRSVGVNLVLGSMGAPVCASAMRFTPLMVMSSMRIKDNLEENTSTFYAELKKLKEIILAVKHQQPVFILLDEILRGTNSNDRHIGSKALIRQLLNDEAIGLVATHDLELATLAADQPGIHNYHFDVQVQGEELFFDYILKDGICNSLNASLLMKKIGIEL